MDVAAAEWALRRSLCYLARAELGALLCCCYDVLRMSYPLGCGFTGMPLGHHNPSTLT